MLWTANPQNASGRYHHLCLPEKSNGGRMRQHHL